MKAFLSTFFASLALLLLSGCDRVTTKGTGGSQDSRGDGASGSVLGNGVRTALIIGNGNYKKLPRLDACPRDAEQMAAAFRKIGVQVHGGKPLVNLTANEMDAALNDFARSLDRGSEAYIYYSGHGTQMGGGNYLLPVDFDARFESQALRQAISLDSILALLEGTQSSLRVVILDACRDPGNFLPGESALKSVHGKGLAEQKVDAPETLVCFATKHGTPALADDTASYYTRALAEEIVKPGRVEDVLKAVARRVYLETDKRQLPFMYGSLLQDHFFAGPPAVHAETPAPKVDVEAEIRRRVEAETDQRVKAEMAKLTQARTAAVTPAASTPFPSIPSAAPSAATPAPRMETVKLETPRPSVTAVTTPRPAGSGSGPAEKATKEAPFVNSLGMKFVPVAGTKVLFSIWDTRVQDYAEYASEKGITPEKPSFEQGPTHPVVNVTWEDAQAFCAWLSKKEGRTYRLPTDAEWSAAVGLGVEQGSTPEEKEKNGPKNLYPWGRQWPPPPGAGNFADETAKKAKSGYKYIDGFDDGYAYTSPVGSFAANQNGLFDMGGNMWQWCEDFYNEKKEDRVLRGASWFNNEEDSLLSACRDGVHPTNRLSYYGFRCVLVISGG